MNIPNDLKYTETHEWVRIEGDVATVGVTDHAQAELTDVVFVDLPQIGKKLKRKEPVAVIESVKAASDIYTPVSGEVIETNASVKDKPSLVNAAPYTEGWLFKLKMTETQDMQSLLTAESYKNLLGG